MLLTERVEIEELGAGQFRQTINLKPIAVREAGVLLAMNQSWADSGDGTTPHIVNRAPLRSRVANDGMRRLFPIPGDDTSYLEIGAPYIKLSGVWTQVSLGTPSRSAHVMTWTRPQTITRVVHAGHYVKLDIELRGGFVPEDSMIAFPVGIQGLTRSGTVISKNGTPVMQLRPLVVEDATNLDDVRPISHQFTNLAGNPYLLLTLPSLTGMSRPRIDPTLSLQPDATAGIDTYLQSNVATTNFGTNASLLVGNPVTGTTMRRTLIKFDLSTIPSDATLDTNTYSVFVTGNSSNTARTQRIYRTKRAWVEAEATWNIYRTGNNWSTAGGFHADDCEQTDIGSRAFASGATEPNNEFKDFVLTPTTKAALDLGNGWMHRCDTETDDAFTFDSSDSATAAQRPKFVSIYTEAGGGYTMAADAGSYTLTGQAAALKAARLLTAAQGSYALTGQAATLKAARLLTAGLGAYTLSGQSVSLLAARLLTAAQGSYSLTGQDVTLTYTPNGGPDYTLTAAAGSYTLSGQAVSLIASRLLTAGAGAYVLTGQPAQLLVSRLLAAGQGSYVLNGQAAVFQVSRQLVAATGSYALDGQAVTFVYSGAEPVVTPSSRVYVVPVEDRVFVIVQEDRTFVVH